MKKSSGNGMMEVNMPLRLSVKDFEKAKRALEKANVTPPYWAVIAT